MPTALSWNSMLTAGIFGSILFYFLLVFMFAHGPALEFDAGRPNILAVGIFGTQVSSVSVQVLTLSTPRKTHRMVFVTPPDMLSTNHTHN